MASPASTACTCASPRRCATRCRLVREPAFVERLDVLFAAFYFEAYQAPRPPTPGSPRRGRHCSTAARSRCSRSSSRSRDERAHQQRSRPRARAHVAGDGREPDHDTPERRDYEKVNGILEAVEADIKVPLSDDVIARRRHRVQGHDRRLTRAVEHQTPRATRRGSARRSCATCRGTSSTACSTAWSASPAICCSVPELGSRRRTSVQSFRVRPRAADEATMSPGRVCVAWCPPMVASGR